MGGRAGGGASGGMGSRSRSGGEITITVGEYQMRQYNSLITYDQVEGIKVPEKFRKEIEDEDYELSTGRSYNSQTYRGDERWVKADSRVMDDHNRWLIGDWEKVKVGVRKRKIKFKNVDDMYDQISKFKDNTGIRIYDLRR